MQSYIISACEQSIAGSRWVKEIWPALPRSALPQHVTAQQRYCKQKQVYYTEIPCRRDIWADCFSGDHER